MHAIRLLFSNYNFDIAQNDNLCFKPFESNFLNTENNIYFSEDTPFLCYYLQCDKYKYPLELSVLHVHCRTNFEKFTDMLKVIDNPFSAIAITETWLFESDAINLYELHNYQLFLKFRQSLQRWWDSFVYPR